MDICRSQKASDLLGVYGHVDASIALLDNSLGASPRFRLVTGMRRSVTILLSVSHGSTFFDG